MNEDGLTMTASLILAAERPRSPWTAFFIRRALSLIVSLWVISTLVFFMARSLGGDAVIAGAGLDASPEYIAARREELGLDRPILVQYAEFLGRLFTLDFGQSISLRTSPMTVIMERFPYTLQLGVLAFLVTALISIPLGMWIAARGQRSGRGASPWFHGITGLIGSIPDFLIGVGLIAVFAIVLRVLPPAGGSGPTAFILPVATLAIGLTASMSRLVATESGRVLREEYVRTARSMRLSTSKLYIGHVLPNVLTAVLTSAGLVLATLLGGTLVTETVFAWPGLGSLTIDSILARDYPMLQAVVLVIATMALLVTFTVDLLVARLDPRSLLVRS